jgi:hypothetical protein
MEHNNGDSNAFRDYGELWNFNLQKIEGIQRDIEVSIRELEGYYAGFESRYDEIMRRIDILSSIYSGFNTVRGSDYVLRLKAVLQSYRKRYTREGLDFNLVNDLLIKINDARNSSFENFPGLSHDEAPPAVTACDEPEKDYSGRKYKWVTFERNKSWFIAPFRSIEIRKNKNFPIVSCELPDYLNVEINERTVRVKDIFIKSLERPDNPRYIILLDRAGKNFAASRVGKRIYADRDVMNPIITPFRNVETNALSPGRVRLFGRNHIFLY